MRVGDGFGEVGFGVAEVVVGVGADGFQVGGVEGTADFARDSGDEGVGRDGGAFGDDGPGGDDGAGADVDTVEDDGAHADEDIVFDGAPVDGGVMADCDAISDDYGVEVLHAVENGAVLYIAAGSDLNVIDVTAYNGVHPDTRVLSEDDFTDDLGRGVDVRCRRNCGGNPLVRAKHCTSLPIAVRESDGLEVQKGTDLRKAGTLGECVRWMTFGVRKFRPLPIFFAGNDVGSLSLIVEPYRQGWRCILLGRSSCPGRRTP